MAGIERMLPGDFYKDKRGNMYIYAKAYTICGEIWYLLYAADETRLERRVFSDTFDQEFERME